ncbi:YciI family protein [Rhodococcus aetherivorans]
MPLFLVTYVHPDPEGWKAHLGPHLEWIAAQVESGALRASGPTFAGDTRSAALIFHSPDRVTLESTLAADPFVEHGQVSELAIAQWDPIFGSLNEDSTQRGRTTEQIVTEILAAFMPSPVHKA